MSESIYQEIGPSKRVSLVKLAIEKYEATGRPLQIAVDTSIWSFQVQVARGRTPNLDIESDANEPLSGVTPALQTLYNRLLQLLSVSVRPLFVFDGADKPLMKRNKLTARGERLYHRHDVQTAA